MNALKGWRTLIGHGLIAVAGLALMFYDGLVAAGVDITVLLPPQIPVKWAGVVLVVISMVFSGLRLITTTAVGKTE